MTRGVISSSEFSDIVWSMSNWLPKLEKVSSVGFLIGLRCRLGGPKGLDGRVRNLSATLGTGEEWARVIWGAEGVPLEERERAWPRAKGERVRGRSGRVVVDKLDRGDSVDGDSGAVARRGVSGRGADISVGRAGRGLRSASSRSTLGGFIIIGGSITRGAMLLFIRYLECRQQTHSSGPC